MKIKTSAVLILSFLLGVGFCLWYIYPIVVYHLFVASTVSEVIPVNIDSIPEVNQKYERLLMGSITFHLPILENMKIEGSAKLGFLTFGSQEGNIGISDFSRKGIATDPDQSLKKDDRMLSFQDKINIFQSSSRDVSIFNARAKNVLALSFGAMKLIARPEAIEIVRTDHLKAICIYSSTGNGDYGCNVDLYNLSEEVGCHMFFAGYKGKGILHEQVHSVLGGVEFSDSQFSETTVQRDIQQILENSTKNKGQASENGTE